MAFHCRFELKHVFRALTLACIVCGMGSLVDDLYITVDYFIFQPALDWLEGLIERSSNWTT